MNKSPRRGAFTLIELLVVISIIAILATLVTPVIGIAIRQGQMTQTLNNARQLQIATHQMTSETLQAGGVGVQWTTIADGNTAARPATVEEYFGALVDNKYVTESELRKLVTAPGKGPGTGQPTASNSCFKFFWVQDSSPSDQPLMVTANWEVGGLVVKANPYGDNGFIVYNKGGGGLMSKRPMDATSLSNFPTDVTKGYTSTILN